MPKARRAFVHRPPGGTLADLRLRPAGRLNPTQKRLSSPAIERRERRRAVTADRAVYVAIGRNADWCLSLISAPDTLRAPCRGGTFCIFAANDRHRFLC